MILYDGHYKKNIQRIDSNLQEYPNNFLEVFLMKKYHAYHT